MLSRNAFLAVVLAASASLSHAQTLTVSSGLQSALVEVGSHNEYSSSTTALTQSSSLEGIDFNQFSWTISYIPNPGGSSPLSEFAGILSDGSGNELHFTGQGSTVLYDPTSSSLMFSGSGSAQGSGALAEVGGEFSFFGKGVLDSFEALDGRVQMNFNLQSAPEPATLAAVALGSALLLRRRRR